MLNKKEKNRYSRHLLLDEIGEEGQLKLKASKVLVIGAGGLGCPVLQYLTAAGVGTIGVIDFDVVEVSNLQRQVLFTKHDIGKNKALVAATRLNELNELVNFNIHAEKLTTNNALELFQQYDIIVDGTDNFATRYLVNDACVLTDKPLVYGAIYKFEGQVTVFNYKGGPTYRCLFSEPPKPGSIGNCAEVGVLGVLPGMVGVQQANEVLKLCLGIGQPLSGKVNFINALDGTQMTIALKRNEEEVEKVHQLHFENHDYDYFCGTTKANNMEQLSAQELKDLMTKEEVQVIDVREPHETPKVAELNALNIPMQSIPSNLDKIAKDKKVIVHCQHGVRSMNVIQYLEQQGFDNLYNLTGGIVTW